MTATDVRVACVKIVKEHAPKIVTAAIASLLSSAWAFTIRAVNTELRFQLNVSSTGLVMLNDPLRSIEQQSRRLCGGGWETVLRVVALKSCRKISFEPRALLNLGICPTDPASFSFSARD